MRAKASSFCNDEPSVAAGSSASEATISDDPFDIQSRFVRQQAISFGTALAEIKRGRKRSCWMWYIFPTAPWIVGGIEKGSRMNREYALRDISDPKKGVDATRAYLRFQDKNVNLRENYLLIATAVAEQLEKGVQVGELMGRLDTPKLKSSLRLFQEASAEGFDDEIHAVCQRALSSLES